MENKPSQWISDTTTQIAKEWIVAGMKGFSIKPESIMPSELDTITFIAGNKEGIVLAHRGKNEIGRWKTQSILIPKIIKYGEERIDVPSNIAKNMANYIADHLDHAKQRTTCV